MHRLHPSRHSLPAAIAVAFALLAPLLAGGGRVDATAGSAVARAAANEPAVAVPAPDARFAVGTEAMTVARQIADQHWGTSACAGTVSVVWIVLEPSVNATASWRNPTDAWNNAAENYDCSIEFNVDTDYDWPKFCTVLAHEIGHLVGNPHAGASGQLMSPTYSRPLQACEGPEPGVPAPAVGPAPVAEPSVPKTAAKQPAAKKTLSASAPAKTSTKRKAKTSKRCTRRFRATRKSRVCAKAARKPLRGVTRASRR